MWYNSYANRLFEKNIDPFNYGKCNFFFIILSKLRSDKEVIRQYQYILENIEGLKKDPF